MEMRLWCQLAQLLYSLQVVTSTTDQKQRTTRSNVHPDTLEASHAKKKRLEPILPAQGRLAFTMGAKIAAKFAHLRHHEDEQQAKRAPGCRCDETRSVQ
eukprot:12235463-Karenia_brevis.AAC.1